MCEDALAFTCSCPMEGSPGEGPEAMDVTLICPAIWPMLLVAILVAMETLLRFMPLLLYMLLLFCWVNCGDACCCENMLRGEARSTTGQSAFASRLNGDAGGLAGCSFTCCLVASRSCRENPEKEGFLGPAASSETACGPCGEKAEGSVVCPRLRSLRPPVGSYLPQMHQDGSATAQTQQQSKILSGANLVFQFGAEKKKKIH